MRRPSAGDGPRIAVVGGGVGGLAVAAFLRQAGLSAKVFEQAREFGGVGGGLVITPNAARLLRRLGVLDRLRRDAAPLDWGWEFRRWQDGTVLAREQLAGVCERLYGERTYVAGRAALLDAIRSAVPEDAIDLGARCAAIEERPGEIRLKFADGSSTKADIVIGADGVHSVVRDAVAETTTPAESGMCAFRSIVPAELAPTFALRRAQTLWVGPGRHLVHYPVDGGRSVNLLGFAPAAPGAKESWSATAARKEFLAEFEGWDPRVAELIRAGGRPGRWSVLHHKPLPRWSTSRITLLGDAAHPLAPDFAQSAAQAIEDAAVLAACLAEHIDQPATALQLYQGSRIPRIAKLQRAGRDLSRINHLPDGSEQRARDRALAAAGPLAASSWIYKYDAVA
ncbi:FAD-dependent monooxygenase [Actinospica sp. MGRD01-02]|uniref:FAD-dependent monooxygenase n=1 Tax=Actinospica acidithermotolerans TaxID=2828514 RepID=A0A941E610_9ACTN|nr:FAD-dependent monooxygenase [Actinospica acidithermotolerans]MBR7826985.1 FAD-dependent monooxygenase [Actinospica acidithermotolerans]